MEVGKNQQLTALFSDHAAAQDAVNDLKTAGLSASDLTLHNESSAGGGFLENVKRFFGGETSEAANRGGALLTVNGNREIALPILRRYDAKIGTDAGYQPAGDATDTGRTMKLHEERLNVDKQAVKAGEVRLGKQVVTEQQSVDVPVAHEEVYVSRRPVGEAEYADNVGEIGDNREIVTPVMREEVSVEKRAVVTEEVGLKKQNVQETQTVGGTVRKERVAMETDGDIGDQVIDRTP